MAKKRKSTEIPVGGLPQQFDPKHLLPGRVHEYEFRCKDLPETPPARMLVSVKDDGQIDDVVFQRLGAPTLILHPGGTVHEIDTNGDLSPAIGKGGAKGYDCDAAVRWSIQYGMNTAFTACVRAMCKSMNCRYAGKCGGTSQFEHDQTVRYSCMGVLSNDQQG
jgi:hypothetical protein